jgi:hypothetical protein
VFPLITWSPEYSSLFEPLLENAVGINVSDEPPESDFGYNLVQFLLEGSDPLAYAPYVIQHPLDGNAPRHVLDVEAYLDETVGNAANEVLASAMGLPAVQVTAGGTPDFRFLSPPPSPTPAPASGNLTSAGQTVTAAFVQFQGGTHAMYINQIGARTRDTTMPPFKRLAHGTAIDNPIEAVQALVAAFASDVAAGRTPQVIDVQ